MTSVDWHNPNCDICNNKILEGVISSAIETKAELIAQLINTGTPPPKKIVNPALEIFQQDWLAMEEQPTPKEKPAPKKKKPAEIKVVNLKQPKEAAHHDAWVFHKSEGTLYYLPHGHHYGLFQALTKIGREDVYMKASSGMKKDTDDLRFGDVKHGIPRTIKENQIQKEPLRTILINLYNEARAK